MSSRLEDLEPYTRDRCQKLLALRQDIRVTWTLRTDDEQNHMYAKGRTLAGEPCVHDGKPRPVGSCPEHRLGTTVTRAKAGESPHNEIIDGRAAAFDFCFRGEVPFPHEDDSRWLTIGRIGESLGLSWGGPLGPADRFTFDRPHFERPGWKLLRRPRP